MGGFFAGHPANALLIGCDRGKSYMFTGSSPNFGLGNEWDGEVNFIFEAEAVLCQQWQVFVDYLWYKSTLLNDETAMIPMLKPAEGTREAAEMWQQYLAFFKGENLFKKAPQIKVDPDNGKVEATKDNGEEIATVSSEIDLPPYSTLVIELGRLYNQGSQVTINKLTRLGPLDAPVKPEYFRYNW